MDEHTLRKALSTIPLGGLRFYEQTGSSNDVALAWAAEGAPDMSLVYAEEQTSGRGRGKRNWFTPPGAALAFSLIIRPITDEQNTTPLFTALGALAVCEALAMVELQAEIKWPNDVLLNRRKVCGILVESVWTGEKLDSIVLGIGINITTASVPPADQLLFPATCLETEAGKSGITADILDRAGLLQKTLQAAQYWRELVGEESFMHAWENQLAFRGEQVTVRAGEQSTTIGRVDGLDADGSLRLRTSDGQLTSVQYGDVHLRPDV
jgi:BirA family biotin operon repressor/biotin-[acetyl-CoA-carboxylase] ligase